MFLSLGNEYFIIYKKVTRDSFTKAAEVSTGSWAEEFINRVYDCLFGNAKNVIEEYEKFYQAEYSTLWVFLEKRYGLDSETLLLIKNKLPKGWILTHGFLDSEGDHNTAQLIENSDSIISAINKILIHTEKQ